jgi:hypothetical protein
MAVALDRGRLTFLTAETVPGKYGGLIPPPAPATAALGFVSGDLAATRAYLAGRGVRLVADEPDRLIVDPGEAMGAALIIEAQPQA